MFKGLNIQTKLFLLLSGLTISVLFVVLVAVNQVSSNTIEQKVLLDFKQLQNFFKNQQALRYDRLAESASLIGENSTFKGNVQTEDPATVAYSVGEFASFTKTDLFVVTDENGSVLAWLNQPDRTGEDISKVITVESAMQGYYPELEPEWPYLWKVGASLYQIVSVPIYAGNRIIGTLTLGTVLEDLEARQLKQQTPLDIVLFMDENIIGSSSPVYEEKEYVQIAKDKEVLIDSLLAQSKISDPFRFQINTEEQLSFISPLGIGERAFYIATVPISREFQALSSIQRNIIVIAAISFFVIIPIAIFLGSIISNPINRLKNAMLKVEDGDLNVAVEAHSNDEIGMLTRAFNKMIVGLRERFALTKYVGDHTLRMIQKNADQHVALGDATTQKLAILFTDIRGSTSKIEGSKPDEFINMLNETLGAQSQIVLQNNGSIDKFVGDSVIALFSGDDAVQRAISAAIGIQRDFRNNKRINSYFDGIGVGVNYGSMLLGNMGANERLDYTVIGSQVNLCARLCSEANVGQILITKELADSFDLRSFYDLEEVDAKDLKGFSNRIEVVEVNYE
jgi:class 3 adenylate cyclase